MVTRPKVAQRIESIVGPVGAGSAEAKVEVGIGVEIDQAGLQGNRGRDGKAKLGRGSIRDRQGPAHLFCCGQQFLEVRTPPAAGVEAVEHHATRTKGKGQLDRLIQVRDVEASGHKHSDELPPGPQLSAVVTNVGHGAQHGVKCARGAGQPVVDLAPMAEQRQLKHAHAAIQKVEDGRLGQEPAVADDRSAHIPLLKPVEDLRQIRAQKRLAAGQGDVAADGFVEGFVQQR